MRGSNFADMIEQQLWCIGRDICHPDGNLLLRYGWSRTRAPAGTHGSSRYAYVNSSGTTCCAWGFGLAIGSSLPVGETPLPANTAHSWLLIRRHPFRVETALRPTMPVTLQHAWRVDQLPFGAGVVVADPSVRLANPFHGLATLFAGYESWIGHVTSGNHRARCDADRPRHVRRRLRVEAVSLGSRWEQIRDAFATQAVAVDTKLSCS